MHGSSPAHARNTKLYVFLTLLAVAAFAACFIGLVTFLDRLAEESKPVVDEEIVIAEEAPADPFCVLVIGSDTRKGTALYTGPKDDAPFADVMTLVRVDPRSRTVTLLSVPRDSVVPGQQAKVNSSLTGNDPQAVVDAVAELTGVKADYYMMTTFASFVDFVDALGGIDVDVPLDVKVGDPETGGSITVSAGPNQHLDGAHALAFARARKEYGEDGEAVRQTNVRAVEAAIMRKVLSVGDVDSVEHLLAVVEDDMTTDMDLPAVGLTVVDFMASDKPVTLYQGTGPYKGGEREDDGVWVVDEDREGWADVVRAFESGKDPAAVIEPPTAQADEGDGD